MGSIKYVGLSGEKCPDELMNNKSWYHYTYVTKMVFI